MNWVIVVLNFNGTDRWVQDVIGPFDTYQEAEQYQVDNTSENEVTTDIVAMSRPGGLA